MFKILKALILNVNTAITIQLSGPDELQDRPLRPETCGKQLHLKHGTFFSYFTFKLAFSFLKYLSHMDADQEASVFLT